MESNPSGAPQAQPPQPPPPPQMPPQGPPPQQQPPWMSNLTSTAPVAGPAGLFYADLPNRIIAYIIDMILLAIVGTWSTVPSRARSCRSPRSTL